MAHAWLAVLAALALSALLGAKRSAPATYHGRLVELGIVTAIFAAGWLGQLRAVQPSTMRICALIVASYALARLGVKRDGSARHLTPCLALAIDGIASGAMGPRACLLPFVAGHVAMNSARWAVLANFVALAPAVVTITIPR